MADRAGLFLTMFRAEIEDSLEGVRYLAEAYENKFKRGEITSYVYSENEAFLAQEIAGLKRFLAFVDTLSPAGCRTVEGIVEAVKGAINKREEGYEDPEAVYKIIFRKIQKILDYFDREKPPEERPV
jgi:hypothetical protein